MPIRTVCSSCDKNLRIRDELIGKKVKCPACGNIFLAEAVDEATAVTAEDSGSEPRKSARDDESLRPMAKKAPPPGDEEDEEREERPARPGKRKKKAALNGMWIGIAASIVLLVVAIGCYFLFFAGPSKTGPIAKKGSSRTVKAAGTAADAEFDPIHPPEAKTSPITFPEFGPSRLIQPGIQFREATLRRGAMPMRVWYYQPENAADKLALVIVPPAGSTLIAGMDLGDGDRAEHYAYAKAGFTVASFEIDGHVPKDTASDAAVLQGARQFRDAQAGLANAKAMLDFILAKVPNVDPNRVYIAGHSSAATLALLVAEHEPRIKACAAYAPVTDVETRLAEVIPQLDHALPGYRKFLHFSAPKTHADKLTCPVFLFHAQDDDVVPLRQSTDFVALLKKTNTHVTLVTSASGGHYDSMIREGIPKGIAWLKQIDKESR